MSSGGASSATRPQRSAGGRRTRTSTSGSSALTARGGRRCPAGTGYREPEGPAQADEGSGQGGQGRHVRAAAEGCAAREERLTTNRSQHREPRYGGAPSRLKIGPDVS